MRYDNIFGYTVGELEKELGVEAKLTNLLNSVCNVSGVTIDHMKKRNRKRELVYLRSSYCRLAREMKPQPTFYMIGDSIGYDHSSVLRMVKEADDVREKRQHYLELKKKLSAEAIIFYI